MLGGELHMSKDKKDNKDKTSKDEKQLVKESLAMYKVFKDEGLTNISAGTRLSKPDNMDDFIVNLERLGYDEPITWLRQGELSRHASGELSKAYSFLQSFDV